MNTQARRLRFRWTSVLALLCIGLPVACKEDTAITDTATVTDGELQLTVITTGTDPDIDGYTLMVDGTAVTQLTPDRTFSLRLPAGDHQVELGDVAPNCRMSGVNARTVRIVPGGKAGVTYQFDCMHFASLDVITTTTGPTHDQDGYVLSLDGAVRGTLGLQDKLHLSLVLPGTYAVRLTSVPADCSVLNGSNQAVTVPDGGLATVTFAVTCVPRPDDTPGEKLVVAYQDQPTSHSNIFLMEPDGTGSQPLVSDAADGFMPDFSRDGSRILFLKVAGSTTTLSIVDRVTREETTLPAPGMTRAVWSPDGGSILAVQAGRLVLMNADGTGQHYITTIPDDRDPYWSPDGTKIAFTRSNAVFVMNRDGSNVHKVSVDLRTAGPWSPDGRYLVINKLEVDTGNCYWYYYYYGTCGPVPSDLVLLDSQTGAETSLTHTPLVGEWSPAWATDGQGIFYVSAMGGNNDIYWVSSNGSSTVRITNSLGAESWVSVGYVPPESTLPVARLRRP